MKKILILLLILFFNYGYSQDISYIKTLDTIYVKFKKDKSQIRFIFPNDYQGFKERHYTINFVDNGKKEFLKFFFVEYSSSEKREKKLKSEAKIVKKSVLKKHKNQTIDIDFFKKYGIIKSTYEAFEKCKVIYIIDKSESKKGKLNIYEVTKFSSYRMGE